MVGNGNTLALPILGIRYRCTDHDRSLRLAPNIDAENHEMRRRTLLLLLALCAGAPLSAGLPVQAAETAALVFGANGRLGSEIVKALLASNMTVTAFVRPSSDRSLLSGHDVRFIEGDARNRADVDKAMATGRFDVVVNAIARRSRSELGLYDASQNNITAAAKSAGVKQVIFFSSVGVGSSRSLYSDAAYARFKSTMEEREAAERALIASGVGYTIIRTGGVVDGDAISGKGYLSEEPRMGAIMRPELARIMADCVGAPRCLNKIFHAVDETQKLPFE